MDPNPQARGLARQGYRAFEGVAVRQQACAADETATVPVNNGLVDLSGQPEVIRIDD